MATEVMMDIGVKPGTGYAGSGIPTVYIEDRADAEVFVRILNKNGVAVNLREVSGESRT